MRGKWIALAGVLVGAMMVAGPVDAKPKHCPPGHAKKGWCSPGSPYALPPGIRWQVYDDWYDRGLRRPRDGEIYVLVDDELLLILEETREVIEVFGALRRLLD